LRKAACGFFGAQTHHMRLFFFFALLVKRGYLRVPVMLWSKKKDIPACGFESRMRLLRNVPNTYISSTYLEASAFV
jgi:hypothetical protein